MVEMRKLALFYVPCFRPIMNHDQLEPVLSGLGFIAQPPRYLVIRVDGPTGPLKIPWREYSFPGGPKRLKWHRDEDGAGDGNPPPMPGLPYQRIDGLHVVTYRNFLSAVNYYLRLNDDIANFFQIRGIPLQQPQDFVQRLNRWSRLVIGKDMGDEYRYRQGTLELQPVLNKSDRDNITSANDDQTTNNTIERKSSNVYGNKKIPAAQQPLRLVQLDDIIVLQEQRNVRKKIKIIKEEDS